MRVRKGDPAKAIEQTSDRVAAAMTQIADLLGGGSLSHDEIRKRLGLHGRTLCAAMDRLTAQGRIRQLESPDLDRWHWQWEIVDAKQPEAA